MAIPFFEPKTSAPANQGSVNNNNNNLNTATNPEVNFGINSGNNSNNLHYDQVDGPPNLSATASATPTAMPNPTISSVTATTTSATAPIQNATTTATTATATAPPTIALETSATFDFNSSANGSSFPYYEQQQSLAWKILALAMCKALREYYLQMASSKDAFTSQTVQVLPNGEIQPLWK